MSLHHLTDRSQKVAGSSPADVAVLVAEFRVR
jgi:hypothetical protein